ncbi:MAG: glycosyltransferase family 9 protein [Candidatus Omnitrophica bacterium]|nr:glycosyltransferase family 9 protein [Candidatus Omnitrophota bacterium]
MKILIANIFGIGDVLFTTPLISNLRRSLDGAEIDYLCNARTEPLIKLNSEISGTIVYDRDNFAKFKKTSLLAYVKECMGFFYKIRRNKYDIVFDFTMAREFGFIFMLAGIRKRIGFNYKNRGLFLTHKDKFVGFSGRHVAEHYLDLLKYADVKAEEAKLRIDMSAELKAWAREYVSRKNLKEGKIVAVVPGGGASWGKEATLKRWPSWNFSKVADLLWKSGVNVIILGDKNEIELCRKVENLMENSPAFVENNLSLEQYAALLSLCDLMVCNDGGPLHIAVALGLKTVSIFGPVDEKVYGPYPASGRNKVITADDLSCRPCYNQFRMPDCMYSSRCLNGIAPERVVEACMGMID